MNLDLHNYLWHDSELVKIEIGYDEYDDYRITVFNDLLQKNIFFSCHRCVGITQIVMWEDHYIDNIMISEITYRTNEILSLINKMYGINKPYEDIIKNLNGNFYELKFKLISGLDFSIICMDVEISE